MMTKAHDLLATLFLLLWLLRFLGAPVPSAVILGTGAVVLLGTGWDLWKRGLRK